MTTPNRKFPKRSEFDEDALEKSNAASRIAFYRAFGEGKSVNESWDIAEEEKSKVYEATTGLPLPGGIRSYGDASNLEDEP